MRHNYAKQLLLLIASVCAGSSSDAQNSNKENSPYSRYAIGEQRSGLNVALKGMASISTAHAGKFQVNTDNPASYASLLLTTYEAGGEGSTRTVIANNQSYGTGTATLSYLTIGIPLGNNFGMAIGLRPHTRVYYRMSDSLDLPGIGPSVKIFSGDGSTNYAFLGFAGKRGGFSAGFNLGYLFGTVRHSSIFQKQYDTVNAYNTDFSNFTKIGGIYWKAGVMYETRIKKEMDFRVGGTLTLGQNVNAWKDEFGSTWHIVSGTTVIDTAIRSENVRGKIKLPMSYSLGAELFSAEKWATGLDFSAGNWSQFRSFGQADSVDNAFKIAIGGEYTPNPSSLYNYLQRVTYRLGFYYGTDYVKLGGQSLNYYAATVGMSLPFKRTPDRVHLALELGKRGSESKNALRENFMRFSIGMSLNDKWFVKRRYD